MWMCALVKAMWNMWVEFWFLVHVIVWRRVLRYGCFDVGWNPASGSFTSGMSTSISSCTGARGPPGGADGIGDVVREEDALLVPLDESVVAASCLCFCFPSPSWGWGWPSFWCLLLLLLSLLGLGCCWACAFSCSTERFTKRPFTLILRSAKLLRQLYRIFLFQTLLVRLLLNLAIMAARSAGVYIPMRPFLL